MGGIEEEIWPATQEGRVKRETRKSEVWKDSQPSSFILAQHIRFLGRKEGERKGRIEVWRLEVKIQTFPFTFTGVLDLLREFVKLC